MTLNLRLGGRVGSPRGRGRLTSEVAVGVGGGGVFPETILDLLVTLQTRPDPRPDPALGPQLHILFRYIRYILPFGKRTIRYSEMLYDLGEFFLHSLVNICHPTLTADHFHRWIFHRAGRCSQFRR